MLLFQTKPVTCFPKNTKVNLWIFIVFSYTCILTAWPHFWSLTALSCSSSMVSVYGITTKVFYRIKNTIKCYQCAVDEGMICIILWFGNQCLDSFNFLLFLPLLFWAEWCTGLNVQVSLRDQDFIRHGQLEKQWYKCPCISFTSAIIKQLNNVQQKRLFTVQCAALLCDF